MRIEVFKRADKKAVKANITIVRPIMLFTNRYLSYLHNNDSYLYNNNEKKNEKKRWQNVNELELAVIITSIIKQRNQQLQHLHQFLKRPVFIVPI